MRDRSGQGEGRLRAVPPPGTATNPHAYPSSTRVLLFSLSCAENLAY